MTEQTADNPGAPPPSRILVIDDEVVLHHSLRRILGRQGHEVEAVLNAEDGLDLLSKNSYHLVISDLMMPGLNGIELLERMRERHFDVPVVMITGYPTIRTAMLALRLGAVDYLPKPFTRQELLAPVNRALRREDKVVEPGEGEGLEAPQVDIEPGDTIELPEHSWAHFRQDGVMEIGIEQSFLRTVGDVLSITTPSEGDLVEQGYTGFRITTASGESHCAYMPVSGQVVDVAEVGDPAEVTGKTVLVRVLPTHLASEIAMLRRRTRKRS